MPLIFHRGHHALFNPVNARVVGRCAVVDHAACWRRRGHDQSPLPFNILTGAESEGTIFRIGEIGVYVHRHAVGLEAGLFPRVVAYHLTQIRNPHSITMSCLIHAFIHDLILGSPRLETGLAGVVLCIHGDKNCNQQHSGTFKHGWRVSCVYENALREVQ